MVCDGGRTIQSGAIRCALSEDPMRLWLVALGLAVAFAAMGGCGSDEATGSDRAEIRLALNDPAPNFTRAEVEVTREVVYLSPQVALTGHDIKSAEVLQTAEGPAVGVQFTKPGSEKLGRFTTQNKGKLMAIVVDGTVAMAPPIRSQLTEGKMLLGGKLTPERAAALAKALGPPPND
jgi:preprotein translocase subunit SecD